MLRNAASKVMWVGRATVFMVGLAVILAMVVGLASAAFSATGGNFILGQSNSANAPTTLVGQIVDTTKSALVLKNPKGGSALQLRVDDGQAPMTVNETAGKATNLTADKVDGVDFPLSGSVIVDPPSVGSHSCVHSSVTIPGKQADDAGILFPTRNFTNGTPASPVTLVTHTGVGGASADQLFYTVCNVSDTATDPPSGFWGFVIVRVP